MGVEGGSRRSSPWPAKAAEGRAANLLAGLPSGGNFAAANIASSMRDRSAAINLDGKNQSKRPNTGSCAASSAHEESAPVFAVQTLESFTVDKLRVLLKERGLSPKGKKDELIARLREASG